MIKRPTVHFSNRLEELAFQLGCQLFKEGSDPFAKRVVLLPSHSLKLYLTSFFASHPSWSVCAGITFKTLLNGALECFSIEERQNFPSPLALSFLVEQEISQGSVLELQEYLEPKTSHKQVWLAEELSRFFYRYSTEEGKALEEWKQKKGWKQSLWHKVFFQSKSLCEEMLKQEATQDKDVHLFGFAYVPAHLYEFFAKRGMNIYFLSPSPYFWEDLCSDEERIFLEKKMDGKKVRLQVKEQMSLFLKDRHPLLASWGKAGRPLLRLLGDTESYLEEEYIDPLLEETSTLNCLQSGLFELQEAKKEISLQDTSFLCLSAPSKLREIEALYETLQELILEHRDIEPKDILVLSPNLEAYFPYIQMVFGSELSRIGYSVHGLSLSLAEENSQGLLYFFSLIESRFDRESLIKFFSYPSVMKKFGWDKEDITLLEEWVEKSRVLWGLDPEHKESMVRQNWPLDAFGSDLPKEGTWQEGVERLIKGLAMDLDSFSLQEEEVVNPWPLPMIEWSDTEVLGEFITAINSLQEDVRPIYQLQEKTIEEWCSLAQKWIHSYFEKTSVEESLIQDLEALKKELSGKVTACFSYTSFKRIIETHFHQKKESLQSSQLSTVKFLSMQLGAAFPSKVICAIGCDEGSFPRTQIPSSFEEKTKALKTPSITEQDRYLFLEMVLHARRAFICSYERMSWKDQKEQGPSLLVQDVMNELDTYCFFSNSSLKPSSVFMRHHPAIAFDRKYFEQDGFQSFSPHLFHLAQNYYGKEKQASPAFSLKKISQAPSNIIDIKDLQVFAKDPLRLYCKKTLGVFFDFVSSKEEEFFLSPLLRSQIKKETFRQGFKASIARAKAKGQLPLGEIGKLAIQDLEEDLQQWQEHLARFDLETKDLFSLELSEDAKEIERKEGALVLPSLRLQVEGKEVLLVGKMDQISSQGFLWAGKLKKSNYVELLLSFLILATLPKSLGIEPQGLLLESGKKFHVSLDNPLEHLALYIKLYEKSLEELCPIRPDWVLDFLTKSKEEIERKRASSFTFKKFFDPYEEWMNKRGAFPEVEELYTKWHADWKEVFSPLLDVEAR